MAADTRKDERRGDFFSHQTGEQCAETHPPGLEFRAACPACGRNMVRDTRNIRHLSCEFCGNEQSLDVLRPSDAARQAESLHDRGLDRILNAIGG